MNELINWWNGLSAELQTNIIIAIISAVAPIILGIVISKFVWPVIKMLAIELPRFIYAHFAKYPVFNYLALHEYKKKLYEDINQLSTNWSTQKLSMGNVFVPIKVNTEYMLPHIVPGEPSTRTIVDLKSAMKAYKRFVLVGDPGSGKTTALKSVGIAALDGDLFKSSDPLPVFVELRNWAPTQLPLDEYLYHLLESEIFQIPNPKRFINRYLQKGNLLLLLDGLDEVADEYISDTYSRIKTFVNQYPDNYLIATSRVAAYDNQLNDITDTTIALTHFSDMQIVTFLRYWAFPPDKSAIELMNALRERQQIMQLCRNPLMLTIITSLYVETTYELPDYRDEFYTTCIDAVLKQWDSRRDIERRNQFRSVEKQRVLQKLALELHRQNGASNEIERDELEIFTAEVLPTIGRAKDKASQIVDEIIKNSGLLVNVGPQRLQFSHLTFQEFFAASEIDSERDWISLYENYVQNPVRWKEVCLLYCGISKQANLLIAKLIENGYYLMAGACIADGKTVDEQLAEQVLVHLVSRLQTEDEPNKILNTLAELASDEDREWASSAYKHLIDYLHSTPLAVNRHASIRSLANIPTQAAAEELVSSLGDDTLRDVAHDALIQLGNIGLPAIESIMRATENEEILQVCLEICSQIPAPDTIDVVIPMLDYPSSRINAVAAWALAVLIQLPAIENVLQQIKIEQHNITDFTSSGVQELSQWVWPFGENEDHTLSVVVATIVQNLDWNTLQTLSESYASTRPDVRIVIPYAIHRYMQADAVNQETFQHIISLLLIGERFAWDQDVTIPYSEDVVEFVNQDQTPSLADIFRQKPQQLIAEWKSVTQQPKYQRRIFSLDTRLIAKRMGLAVILVMFGLTVGTIVLEGLKPNALLGIAIPTTIVT
ncbi:MAG: NACHT domain-containing protein, partial [Chloroflexota bacterium]